MGAFEPPPLGSPTKPTQTKALGKTVVLLIGAIGFLSVGAFFIGIPWTRYRAERFCARAPAVGAPLRLESVIREAVAQSDWVSLSVRDETRRQELLEIIARMSLNERRLPFVHAWSDRPASITVDWHFGFPSTGCVVEYERGIVTRKYVRFVG